MIVYYPFIQGIEKYEFNKLLDIHMLKQQRHSEIKDPFIKKFGSFQALKSYAQNASDPPLLGKIKVTPCKDIIIYMYSVTES